jgi:hypothetical protein
MSDIIFSNDKDYEDYKRNQKERREKLKQKIADIICDYDIELANSHELAEEIMKEIEKEE